MRSSLKAKDTLGACQVAVAWPGTKPFPQRAASSEQDEPASGAGFPRPQVIQRLGAGRPSKRGDIGREAGVAATRGLRSRTDEMMREHQLHLSELPDSSVGRFSTRRPPLQCAPSGKGRNEALAASEPGGTGSTCSMLGHALAFPAAKAPLLRATSSKAHEPASRAGSPTCSGASDRVARPRENAFARPATASPRGKDSGERPKMIISTPWNSRDSSPGRFRVAELATNWRIRWSTQNQRSARSGLACPASREAVHKRQFLAARALPLRSDRAPLGGRFRPAETSRTQKRPLRGNPVARAHRRPRAVESACPAQRTTYPGGTWGVFGLVRM